MPGVEHPLGKQPGAALPQPPRPPQPQAPQGAITLAQFLKVLDLVQSGGHAKALVRSGVITVNGQAEDRPGRKLVIGDKIAVDGQEFVVDR